MSYASATALEQKGHWKSENSTIVTRALSGPLAGSPASEILTGASSNGGGSDAAFLTSARTAATVLPSAKLFIATDASLRLYPHVGSFMRHSAIFIVQPHVHCSSRM